MTNDLARWQFATTSIYHFLFVPVTIGLAFLVALLQTAWYRNEKPEYRRLTKFFGTLLVINVAVGVVTGLVQEFEFGMNWSAYSRFVGDVFGAPLAMEGLAAFFLESTFLGLWLFGWDRLPKRVHLACIWLVAIGTMLSAMFILAANSWMQHPVGYALNSHGQPELNNIGALFTNPTFLWGYVHVILASLVTGSLVMLAVSAWYLRKRREVATFRSQRADLGDRAAAGDPAADVRRQQARRDRDQVPADQDRRRRGAVGQTASRARSRRSRSAAARTTRRPSQIIEIPHLLSVLATGTWNGAVDGPEPAAEGIRKEIRAGQLRPGRVHPVLVDARDGLPRRR